MRVITGSAKGRKLMSFTDVIQKGGRSRNNDEKQNDGCRPTSDYLKGAMFSRIQFEIAGRRALDLFAGTGQLGIEALSRGAEHSVFVDRDTSVVRKNLETTGLYDKASVIQGDALAFLKSARERFDLIFLDPPYKSTLLDEALQEITAVDILNIGGIIICESQKEHADFCGYNKSTHWHSSKVITLYRRNEVNE